MAYIRKVSKEEKIEAIIEQSSAMVKIADGYDITDEEKEISRKCLKGEMSWKEGYKKMKARLTLAKIIARHAKKDVEQVMKDMETDLFMSAHEAKDYGLVDQVMEEE